MKTFATLLLVGGALALATPAAAQAQCGYWETGSSQRIRCLQMEADRAREEARAYQEIERDLRRTHEGVGSGLFIAGQQPGPHQALTGVASGAWNAPRYAYDGYNYLQDRGREARAERERERQTRRERRRRN
ncbi:MAG: hypothetical protein AB7T59_17875 [Hyphomonadaceae bacterium]